MCSNSLFNNVIEEWKSYNHAKFNQITQHLPTLVPLLLPATSIIKSNFPNKSFDSVDDPSNYFSRYKSILKGHLDESFKSSMKSSKETNTLLTGNVNSIESYQSRLSTNNQKTKQLSNETKNLRQLEEIEDQIMKKKNLLVQNEHNISTNVDGLLEENDQSGTICFKLNRFLDVLKDTNVRVDQQKYNRNEKCVNETTNNIIFYQRGESNYILV
jgi:hypothetical protein